MKLKCTKLKYYKEDYVAVTSIIKKDIDTISDLMVELGEDVVRADDYNIILTQAAIFLIEMYIPDATIKD